MMPIEDRIAEKLKGQYSWRTTLERFPAFAE